MLSEILEMLGRGMRLKCPCCGHGPLFQTRFQMYEQCVACDERFEREPGQGFGTIYINLILTDAIVVTGFLLTNAFTSWSLPEQLAVWIPVAAAGPILLYRVAKGLWTSIIFFGEGLYLAWPTR